MLNHSFDGEILGDVLHLIKTKGKVRDVLEFMRKLYAISSSKRSDILYEIILYQLQNGLVAEAIEEFTSHGASAAKISIDDDMHLKSLAEVISSLKRERQK